MNSTSNMQVLWMHHGTILPPLESWDTEHCLLNPSAQKAWNGRVQLYLPFARWNYRTLHILPRLIPRGQIWVTAVWALRSLVRCPAWHLGPEMFGKSSESSMISLESFSPSGSACVRVLCCHTCHWAHDAAQCSLIVLCDPFRRTIIRDPVGGLRCLWKRSIMVTPCTPQSD